MLSSIADILSGFQVSQLTLDPPLHSYQVSYSHEELHPSPLLVFASSHSFLPMFLPSPQISVQTSALVGVPPVQTKPGSKCQVESHPSPL